MANQRFENALNGVAQRVPPIWFMRQAGRYHRHYQNLRLRHTFMELCKNPNLAAEVALGPIIDFDFDVAILFSDLLFPLEALGMGLEYGEGGPRLGWHLTSEKSLEDLNSIHNALPILNFQREALICTRSLLPKSKSLIGFVGGPWTLYTYAVQGRHDGNLTESKKNLTLFSRFSEILVPLLIENIKLQFEGGAEVVMLFDTAAGELSPQIFRDIVAPQLEILVGSYPGKLAYYSKGTHEAHLSCEVFRNGKLAGMGFDHRWEMKDLLSSRSHSGFIQGCFDQSLLFMESSKLRDQIDLYLEPLIKMTRNERKGWICGLGHGVLPGTPEANVKFFVNYIREALS